MSNFNEGWYLIYTRPRHEKKVAEQLAHVGLSYLLPMVKSLRTWSDRRKYMDTPLFPSYVFVQLSESDQYFTTLSMYGVLCYVRCGKEIARVEDAVMHNLQLISGSAESAVSVSADRFEPGEKVLVCEGPFAGFNCEVVRHHGKHKALVRMDIIQRNLLVDIAVSSLQLAVCS
ncbi:MAG: UpxY family transcription antiterminator [Bacteroidetes bacterium]|nr:UpxY family transcription antiterminator [Bacteroidota bacterium]